MLRLDERWIDGIGDYLSRFLYDYFFRELYGLLAVPKPIYNSQDDIIDAIRSGKIQYRDGVFTGKFTLTLSRELSKFAEFDARSRVWKGIASPGIKAAAIIAEGHRAQLLHRIDQAINQMESGLDTALQSLEAGKVLPLADMDKAVRIDLKGAKATVAPLDLDTAASLRERYTESQVRNIKNWQPEQVKRLRDMVANIQTSGDKQSIQELLGREWQVSANKAKFLAGQETRLFFSDFSLERAGKAGVTQYRWSTAHDERVRESHKELDGKIISISDPPIVDKHTGRRAHAGEDFGCRCGKIWIL